MGKFIVIEGLDGSGKSTQISLLKDYLKNEDIKYKYLHFPQINSDNSPIYGELIAKFLRGEFGEINEVNPYLVSLIFAGDRNNFKKSIEKWLKEGFLVIVDRYVYSNIAFQSAKFNVLKEKHNFQKWIKKLEYNYYNLPKPDISLYLNVPFDFITEKLNGKRNGENRKYLKGGEDIHEKSLDLQAEVQNEYLRLIKENSNFYSIDCYSQINGKKKILSSEEIHQKIKKFLIKKEVL